MRSIHHCKLSLACVWHSNRYIDIHIVSYAQFFFSRLIYSVHHWTIQFQWVWVVCRPSVDEADSYQMCTIAVIFNKRSRMAIGNWSTRLVVVLERNGSGLTVTSTLQNCRLVEDLDGLIATISETERGARFWNHWWQVSQYVWGTVQGPTEVA